MDERPRVPRAVKCAVFLRECSHETRIHRPGDGHSAALSGVIEKMIQDITQRVVFSAELQNLCGAGQAEMIDIPPEGTTAGCADRHLVKMAAWGCVTQSFQ